ncbi:MAG: hypothetical protein ABI794_11375 [Betaproteobacteria bacterium]
MFRKLVMIAIASGLAVKGLQQLLQRAETRAYARLRRDQKVAVNRWEDEGGLVPDAATPAVAPVDR